jgi:hypothetical protein
LLPAALFAWLVGMVVFHWRKTKVDQGPSADIQSKASCKVQSTLLQRLRILLFLLALTLQIQSFNFLFPILLNHERMWGPMVLGIVDACSGLGSIVALFMPITLKKYAFYACLLMVGFFDLIVSLSPTVPPIAGFAFIVAFAFTLVRIQYQQRLYASYYHAQEAAVWSGHLAYNTVLLQGLAPLILGYIVEKGITASNLFLGLAGLIPLLTIVLHGFYTCSTKATQCMQV